MIKMSQSVCNKLDSYCKSYMYVWQNSEQCLNQHYRENTHKLLPLMAIKFGAISYMLANMYMYNKNIISIASKFDTQY